MSTVITIPGDIVDAVREAAWREISEIAESLATAVDQNITEATTREKERQLLERWFAFIDDLGPVTPATHARLLVEAVKRAERRVMADLDMSPEIGQVIAAGRVLEPLGRLKVDICGERS